MADVVNWVDVPPDQRRDGRYQGYGPTQHRGCAAAVRWPGDDGYHRCAGNVMQATSYCRKHSERLGLVAPIVRFDRIRAHDDGTCEVLRAGRVRSSTECLTCARPIRAGALASVKRSGVEGAICAACQPIHEAPGYWDYRDKCWKYRPEKRVEGCSQCDEELGYLGAEPCPTCGGSGRVRSAEPPDA